MSKRLGLLTLVFVAAFASISLGQETEIGSKQFDNGGVYEGTFRNGLQHGTGTFRMPNGYEYSGD